MDTFSDKCSYVFVLALADVGDPCKILEMKDTVEGRYLKNHEEANFTEQTEAGCIVKCLFFSPNRYCQSANYFPVTKTCLTSTSNRHQHPEDFVYAPGSVYLGTMNDCAAGSCPSDRMCKADFLNGGFSCVSPIPLPRRGNANPCDSSPCSNHSVCNNPQDGKNYTCTCSPGYTGRHCDTVIPLKPCVSSPCSNGSVCNNTQDGKNYTCTCSPGYTGRHCDTVIPLKPCVSSPCSNGSVCNNTQDGKNYTCTCSPGYTGRHCDTVIPKPCDSSPCSNGSVCNNTKDGKNYTCTCSPGYTGRHCDTVIPKPCDSSPCSNGGVCNNTQDGKNYTCTCSPGYTGRHCDTVIPLKSCVSSPCSNGSVCNNTQDGKNYTCTCSPGYTGRHCDTVIPKPCDSSPCSNGSVCNNTQDGKNYTCTCSYGYTGRHCNTLKKLSCEDIVCQYGGTCITINDGIGCVCAFGFTGSRCETPIECVEYHNLSEPDGNVNAARVGMFCDNILITGQWYRFVGAAGTRLINHCPTSEHQHCNTDNQVWLIDDQPKPREIRKELRNSILANYNCYEWPGKTNATHCNDFIVYQLWSFKNCYIRYCTEG
ncbi:fibropellin-1 isoform X2 [Nematostella vectensis]|uniref:fibropellin-1 isoform X2 n=1 Tax=Nematostella vectensis TaxID=45351 RepID=UPI0020770CB6|nr:fibropellin-1 isoform X2 [Nematostella vectensis]